MPLIQFSVPAVFEATELDFLTTASVIRSYHSCLTLHHIFMTLSPFYTIFVFHYCYIACVLTDL